MTSPQTGIKFTHIRHATSILEINHRKFLIDPMLSDKESMPAVILSDNKLKNPRIDLPIKADSFIGNIDFLLLTHMHFDHFDSKAIELISKKTPVLCSAFDVRKLNRLGFSETHSIDNEYTTDGIKFNQFPAVHGKGFLKYLMGKGSSYLLNYQGFKIFLTGDCLLTTSLLENLSNTRPDIVIVNAGAARFRIGKPITMSISEVQGISKMLPTSKIIVVHLDALNHCSESRDYCRKKLQGYKNIYIPANGEEIEF
ncbi:MAG: MBL fold metallo-hydrolase [Bacteroidales bacterium]|nr:MBL fold metallo-hydrolase [Bacteroidales bacterium]